MAIEDQILNFVVQVTDKAATTTAKAIAGGFDFLKKTVAAVTGHTKALAPAFGILTGSMTAGTKALGGVGGGGGLIGGLVGVGGALGLLTAGVTKAMYSWGKFHVSMLEFRKQTGMSRVEMTEFNLQVIDAARQYGVEMSKVGDIARMVSYGTKLSKEGIAKMSAELAQFSQVTGTSGEATAQLGDVLKNVGRLGPEEIRKLTYGIKKISDINAPAEKVVEVLAQVGGSIGKLPISMRKDFIEQVPAFASSLMKTGMSVSQITELINSMADANSWAGKQLDAAGGKFGSFLSNVNQMTAGAIDNQYSIKALEGTYHISAEALTGMSLAAKESLKVNEQWMDSQKKTTKEIDSDMRAMMTPMEKLHSSWLKFEGAAGHAAEAIMPLFAEPLDWLASKIDKAADYWTGPGGFLKKLEAGVEELARRAGEVTGMTKGMSEEGKSAFGPAFVKDIKGKFANPFTATGGRRFDLEAAGKEKYDTFLWAKRKKDAAETLATARANLAPDQFELFKAMKATTGRFPEYRDGQVVMPNIPSGPGIGNVVPVGPAMPVTSMSSANPDTGPTADAHMIVGAIQDLKEAIKPKPWDRVPEGAASTQSTASRNGIAGMPATK